MCTKDQQHHVESQVMLYLNLRDHGCSKSKARLFCNKKFCQIDQTQNYMGPSNFKILKLLPDKNLSYKGWQPAALMKFDLEHKYQSSKQYTQHVTKQEKAVLDKYEEFEKKRSEALLQKMMAMKNYVSSMKNTDTEEDESPKQKIKRISHDLQANSVKSRRYFEYNSVQYHELVDQLPNQIRSGSTVDPPLQSFDDLFPPGFNPKVKFRKNKYTSPSKSKQSHSAVSSLDNQAKLILALSKSPGLRDSLDPSGSKSPEKPDQDLINLLKKQNQKLELAEEFNQTQYLFSPQHSRVQSQDDTNNEQVQLLLQKYSNYSQSIFPTQQQPTSSPRTTTTKRKKLHLKLKTLV